MAINKKLITFETRANFDTRLANNEINDTSIVFIKDTGLLWTHSRFFCEDYSEQAGKLAILLTKTYENVLRNNATYTSPYTNSYLYFGSVKTTDLTKPSHVKYRVLAYAPSNASYLLESIVEWYFGNNGIYKAQCAWNNLSSTSYYPFGYHTLYYAKTAAIATSDGSYLGCYYGSSNGYGLSPNTVARTIKIDILECNNCTVELLNNVVWLHDTLNVAENLRLPSTSVAYNDTNFTAVNVSTLVGLQETGDANSDTVGYSIRTNSYSKPMTSALGYGYRLLFTSGDKTGWVPANNSTSSNATAVRTPATDPIDPFGEIVYYSESAAVAAGSRPSATSLWLQYTITLGYSFNTTGAALTLTSWKPIYVKCAPLTNGSAILQGYTLDLPTTEDGFIYIYLGVAYSATAFELVFNHPVYYFKNGAVRLWTNELDPVSPTINYVFIEGEEINIGELFGDRIEGYVRVSGISDPEMTYREYKRVSELSSVFSVFKPCLVGNNFTPQGTCGKILHVLDTLDWEHDVKGNVVSLDGSMGEVMICNTETIYVLLTVIEVDSVRYDTALYSKTPFEWNGYCAEEFKPMGIAPSYCVAHKDEDNVTRMHSVYNSNWNGSWSSPVDNEGKFVATDDGNGGIIETFDSSANIIGNASGKSSTNISLPVGEQYAMNLNDDTTKTVPYYNSHAWALEVMHVGLMLAEGGTFASHSVSLMGSGFSSNYAATAATYWDESNSDARNGFRYIKSDGTTWGYYSLGSNANFGNGATGDNLYKACMLNQWRTPWNIFEQQRVLMYAAANSIEELTWFAFEGNTYKYRSVEGFKGLSDGVMTAVVWKKVAAKLAANCVEPGTSNSVGGNRCEWLISSAVYRGVITDVSPSWWTSGLWMCQWGTDNTMHAYICKEQSKMVKSEQTSAVDEDVILPHENAEGYLPLQTLNATNGYAKDRSEETIFWPSSTSTQTEGGLNTYVGGYKYLGGTRPAEGEKLPRGFRRGFAASYSFLSPVCVGGYRSPSFANSSFGFGTCCVIQT